jgi:hypothetical protein
MNRGWSRVARGKHELSDRTKFQSIQMLNTALMERLGEVTGQLIRAQEEIQALKRGDDAELHDAENYIAPNLMPDAPTNLEIAPKILEKEEEE